MMKSDPGNNPPIGSQNRRQVLAKGVAGAFALTGLGMKGTVLAQNILADPTPGLTEGPYWVDEMLNRSDIRVDPATGIVQVGFPLRLAISVSQLDNGVPSPLPGSVVDIWHCNSMGVYSDIAAQNTLGQKFLRGTQVTNAHGNAMFVTIYPGWYTSRAVHIHFRVRVYDAATATVTYNFVSQLFFDDRITDAVHSSVFPYNQRPYRDTLNAIDNIYNGDGDDDDVEDGEELLVRLSNNRQFAIASFNVALDLTNGNGNGDDQDGGGPGGPPADGGGPGGLPPGGGPGGPPPGSG